MPAAPSPAAPTPAPVADPAAVRRAWSALPEALARARASSVPDAALDVATCLLDLHLRELAAVWAGRAAAAVAGHPAAGPRLVEVARRLETLPPARVDPEALVARAEAALARRRPVDPDLVFALEEDGTLDRWRQRTRGLAWSVAASGDLVACREDVDPADPAWFVRAADFRAAAAACRLHENVARSSGVPTPVIVLGCAAPWLLERLHEHHVPVANGARAALLVVEADPFRLLDAFAGAGDHPALGEARLRFFAGPDAGDRLLARLDERAGAWSAVHVMDDQASGRRAGAPRVDPDAFTARLQTLAAEHRTRTERLVEQNRERYAPRTAAAWRERFAAAAERRQSAREASADDAGGGAEGGEPLRMLVVTSRFTTYVGAAGDDIARALRTHGVRAEVCAEPDDAAEMGTLFLAGAIDRLRPDALVLINCSRADVRTFVPDGLPIVSWVQDAMPRLFTAEAGRSIGAADLVVGSIFRQMAEEHGYPAERCLRMGVPASAAKFRRSARPAPAPFTWDVIAATNHSEPPEAMRERLEAETTAYGAPSGLARTVCDETIAAMDEWDWGWITWHLDRAVGRALERHGLAPDSPAAPRLCRDVAAPLANRILRHRVLRWAAELARERGVRFALFGRGWDDDAELAPFAQGPLAHGAALRDAYADAAVTLHAGAHWIMHQRIHECALAGGLPATLRRPEDAAHALRPAREHLREAWERGDVAPIACRLADRAHCVPATDDPAAAIALGLAQRLHVSDDVERHGRVFNASAALATGLVAIGAGDLRPVPPIAEAEPKLEQLRLVDAMSDAMFATRDELATLIARATEDRAWRDACSARLARLAERTFSYEAATRAILDRLAAPAHAATHATAGAGDRASASASALDGAGVA